MADIQILCVFGVCDGVEMGRWSGNDGETAQLILQAE